MFTLSGFITGTIMTVLGLLGVKYTFWIHRVTGAQDWLERYTGPGSTYGIYKIFFALLVLMGILFATGFGHNVMSFFFSPLTHLFKPVGSSN